MTRADVGRNVGWTLKLLALSLLAIELLYVLCGNVLLGTGWLERIVGRDPDSAGLEYASAWTVFPGWIRATDVEFHMQDSAVQWSVRMDHANLHIELGELFSRKVHFARLSGDGVVFRLRVRVPPNAIPSPRVGTLPPIPGYSDPLAPMGPDEPSPTDENYDLWTAQLEGIDAEVREIWIQEYRYVGAMHASGGFYLKPLRRLEVTPSSFEVRSGELTLGEHTVLTGMTGQVIASIEAFDPRGVDRGLFRHVTGRAVTSGQVPSLEFVQFYLGADSPVKLADGSGAIESDVAMRSGVAVEGSSVGVRTSRLDVRAPGVTTSVAADVTWRAGAGAGELTATASHATFYRSKSKALPASADDVLLTVLTPVDLAGPMNFGPATLDIGQALVPDLRWFEGEEPGPADLRSTGGAAELSGKLALTAEGQPSGKLRIALQKAGFEWGGVRVEGYATGTADILSADWQARSVRLSSRAEVRDVAIRNGADVSPGWWASITGDPFEIGVGSPPELRVALVTKCRDARAATQVLAGRGVLPGWVADLIEMEGATASADLRVRGERIDLTLRQAKGKGSVIAGRVLRRSPTDTRGAFLIEKSPLTAGVSFGPGGVSFHPLAGNDWLKREVLQLDR